MTVPAVILAGGLGTRLRSITGDRYPKPMVPVPLGGRTCPFLEFPLAHLRAHGVGEVVLCIGHLGEQIRRHFGDGSRFGLTISYDDAGAAETACRVLRAGRRLRAPEFVVLCGDVYHPLDIEAFMVDFRRHAAWDMQLAVGAADGEGANVALGDDGVVIGYDRAGICGGRTGIETGTLALRSAALDDFGPRTDLSLTADIYPRLIARRALGGFATDAAFFDIGSPAGYDRFRAFVASGGATPLSQAA